MNTSASIDDLSKLSYITTKQHSFVVSYVDKREAKGKLRTILAPKTKRSVLYHTIYILHSFHHLHNSIVERKFEREREREIENDVET